MLRIHIDFTDVVRHAYLNDTITGIQRVQLEIAREMIVAAPGARVFSYLIGSYEDLTDIVRATLPLSASGLYAALRGLFGRSGSIHPRTGGLRERRANVRKQFDLLRLALKLRPKIPAPEFGPGDLIYVGGAFWSDPNCLDLYERADQRGATLVAFIHDLIPLTAPQFTSGGAVPFFRRLLRLPLHVIVNSLYSRDDLFKAQRLIEGSPDFRSVSVIPLAHEFVGVPRNQPAGAAPSARLRRLDRAGPFALSVGTIEIRKNHWELMQLWARLRLELGARLPRLVVAGKRGWMADAALAALDRADYASPFLLIEAPTDVELAWLYARASFTIFPSLAEGWGLPTGESLWFGTPCIASQTGSIREVGGDLCDYADPLDIESFAPLVRRMAADPAHANRARAAIAASSLRTWSAVSSDVRTALLKIAEPR